MSYATPDELAVALNDPRLATTQPELLAACLEAAAAEIDAHLDRVDSLPLPDDDPMMPLVNRTNVNRAVEWYKAPAAANGGVGFDQIGVLTPPASGFGRHAAALTPATEQWGVG